MLPDDQRLIASRYGLSDPKVMVSWIRSLNYLRNVGAHHSRLWNRNMTEQPKKPKMGDAPLFDQTWSNNAHMLARPFIGLCLIQFFLQTINPTSSWWQRLTDLLLNEFPDLTHLDIDLNAMGIIEGWKEWKW